MKPSLANDSAVTCFALRMIAKTQAGHPFRRAVLGAVRVIEELNQEVANRYEELLHAEMELEDLKLADIGVVELRADKKSCVLTVDLDGEGGSFREIPLGDAIRECLDANSGEELEIIAADLERQAKRIRKRAKSLAPTQAKSA